MSLNSGLLHAWHYQTMKPVRLSWRSGKFLEIKEVEEEPLSDIWVAPALWDLQVNGYAGVDFQQDNLSATELLKAVRALRRDGCAKFLLTLITDEWTRMVARVRHYATLAQANPENKSAILGFHIEGPFLSSEPGFCGAHDPRLMIDATSEHLDQLLEAAGDFTVLLTVAPERFDSELTAEASARGIHINFGHTDCSTEDFQWHCAGEGAFAFTHLGNGCPQMLDRHDNIIVRALDHPHLKASVIPDGIHVPSALFRLIHGVKHQDIYYVSDAMSAAGAGPGEYRLGKLTLEVKEDGIVRLPGSMNFAGSSLRPIDGVFNAAQMLAGTWQEVWKFFSENPAKRLDRENLIKSDLPADFCVLEEGFKGRHQDEPTLHLTTYVSGVAGKRVSL